MVEGHRDFRLFSRHESHWYHKHHGSFFSQKYLSYNGAQNCKKVIETIKHNQHWILNSVSFDVSAKAFLYFNLLKTGVMMSCCALWPDCFFFFFLNTLCTLQFGKCLNALHWVTPQGTVDCLHSWHKSLLKVKLINPPQVTSRKGRWQRKRGVRGFPHLENKFRSWTGLKC